MSHYIRTKTILIYSILGFIIFLSSCRARFYTANRHPVPLFRQEGEIYIDGSTNLFNKLDFTAGMALDKNIGAYLGYSGAAQSFGSDSTGNNTRYRYSGNMVNLGVGYFVNQEQSQTFRFDIYGDFAYGTFRNRASGYNNGQFNGNYTRLGIMPSIGYRSENDKFLFAYSARVSQLKFMNAKVTDSSTWRIDIDRLNYAPSYMMLEHALTLRFGSDKVKFQVQGAFYQGMNADRVYNYAAAVPYFNASFMLGVVFTMNTRK